MSEEDKPAREDQTLARSANEQELAREPVGEEQEPTGAEQQEARQEQGTQEEARQPEEEQPEAGPPEGEQGEKGLVDKAMNKAREKGLVDEQTAAEVREKGVVDAIKDRLTGR